MCSIVEKDTNSMIWQLVPKAILVRVVHPFCNPLEGCCQLLFGNTVCFWHVLQTSTQYPCNCICNTSHCTVFQAWKRGIIRLTWPHRAGLILIYLDCNFNTVSLSGFSFTFYCQYVGSGAGREIAVFSGFHIWDTKKVGVWFRIRDSILLHLHSLLQLPKVPLTIIRIESPICFVSGTAPGLATVVIRGWIS